LNPAAYETDCCDELVASAEPMRSWRERGIRLASAVLVGSYPDTRIEMVIEWDRLLEPLRLDFAIWAPGALFVSEEGERWRWARKKVASAVMTAAGEYLAGAARSDLPPPGLT
jgi:hypothetical protein